MSKRDYHVVPNTGRGGWDVKREGADRASEHSTVSPMRWSGEENSRANTKPSSSSTVGMVAFKIATVTGAIRTRPRIGSPEGHPIDSCLQSNFAAPILSK
jgi:hypothetical protein